MAKKKNGKKAGKKSGKSPKRSAAKKPAKRSAGRKSGAKKPKKKGAAKRAPSGKKNKRKAAARKAARTRAEKKEKRSRAAKKAARTRKRCAKNPRGAKCKTPRKGRKYGAKKRKAGKRKASRKSGSTARESRKPRKTKKKAAKRRRCPPTEAQKAKRDEAEAAKKARKSASKRRKKEREATILQRKANRASRLAAKRRDEAQAAEKRKRSGKHKKKHTGFRVMNPLTGHGEHWAAAGGVLIAILATIGLDRALSTHALAAGNNDSPPIGGVYNAEGPSTPVWSSWLRASVAGGNIAIPLGLSVLAKKHPKTRSLLQVWGFVALGLVGAKVIVDTAAKVLGSKPTFARLLAPEIRRPQQPARQSGGWRGPRSVPAPARRHRSHPDRPRRDAGLREPRPAHPRWRELRLRDLLRLPDQEGRRQACGASAQGQHHGRRCRSSSRADACGSRGRSAGHRGAARIRTAHRHHWRLGRRRGRRSLRPERRQRR